ncbi:Soluble quinoprotein glucose dehydrogenase [Glarea lozoyensis ATCC 20868]|uniref:Soluble quinoprotein glucose dehydrogenase n=2 Tax=Glarea lozoyensis TaxID=101852 RepID=S3DZR4_GLAL2|nr:Soluble quinoprotein glucose dehydrogenase [Glarea lozoyensis ATCC 20868]EPE31773.1 Soluble quinoprotein glucose dehydrogenase [Glarea lozoyensis ATCC 20868]
MILFSNPVLSLLSGVTTVLLLVQPHANGQACNSPAAKYPATFAGGLSAKVLINGLKNPRSLRFDTLGNLLVVEQGGAGVRQIKLTDDGTNVCVASSKQIIADNTLNHGIELSADGKTLYVSSVNNLDQYTYDAAAGTATNKKTLVNSMKNGGGHLTRTLLIPKAYPDLILMGRGSDGNVDQGAKQTSSGRSQIRLFNLTQVAATPVAYATGGTLFAWGLRNPVGIGENPVTGEIWSIDQGEDDIKRSGKDVHNTNPGEKLNFHGLVSDTKGPLFGANYGYPECVPAYDTSVLGISGIKTGEMFWVEGTTQTTTQDANCKSRIAPRLVFPAHNSPIDIKFNKDGSRAYVTWHGSWDRNPPDGYRLDRVEFLASGQPKEPSTSTQSGLHVMSNNNMGSCPGSCFRPSGLAFDSKDRLFMTSDSSGEIFVLKGT